MRIIKVKNPEILKTPATILDENYTSGTSLTIEDSSGFSDNDLILVGGRGNEQAETTDLTATPPNSTTLTVTALNFEHDTDEPIQKILWNQFDVQYKTTSGGSWQSLAANESFDWGEEETEYIHSDGQSSYYYRIRYYNSATSSYSAWSDTIGGGGYERDQVGYLINKVRKKGKDENGDIASDKDIMASFNTVNDIIKGLNRRWWFLKDEYDITTVADTKEYDLPSDFERGHRLRYHYNDGTENIKYYLRYKPKTFFDYEYRDQDVSSDDDLQHYATDEINDKLLVGPPPETAGYTMTLVYYKSISDLDSYGDEIVIPLPDLYVNYAVGEIWEDKDNEKKAGYYKTKFQNMLSVLEQMREKSPTPKSFKTFKGRKPMKRYFGSKNTYSDEDRENYW